MKTDAVKWHMLNGGLSTQARFRISPSDTYRSAAPVGEPLAEQFLIAPDGSYRSAAPIGEPLVEQFTVHAPDGGTFLVQITKLKTEDGT